MEDAGDAGAALAALVRERGADALSDARQVRAVLRDAAPHDRLEVSLLVAAVEEGVAARLARSSTGLLDGEIARSSEALVSVRGLAPPNATWAVRTVAWALGRTTAPGRLSLAGSSPQPWSVPTGPTEQRDEGTAGSVPGKPDPDWQAPRPEDWSWVALPARPSTPEPVDERAMPDRAAPGPETDGTRSRLGDRRVRRLVVAGGLLTVAAVIGVVVALNAGGDEAFALDDADRRLLDLLPEEYSEDEVCRHYDRVRPSETEPLATIQCYPGQASWADDPDGADLVWFEMHGSDEQAAEVFSALVAEEDGAPCPDDPPDPDPDGTGFRERVACFAIESGGSKVMRLWEAGVIAVTYGEAGELDGYYEWFDGEQARVGA